MESARGWVRMFGAKVSLAALVLCMAYGQPRALAGIPDIGGTPIHTEEDLFSGQDFELLVYSYVYFGVGPAVPPGLSPLAPGETLFAYYAINTGAADVDFLAVNNPDGIPIFQAGLSPGDPEGANPDNRDDPDVIQAGVVSAEFGWTEFPPLGLTLLEPGEWSVVYYRVFGFWQPVDAFAGNLDVFDIDDALVPGPAIIPEPLTVSLLVLGGIALLWRRRAR